MAETFRLTGPGNIENVDVTMPGEGQVFLRDVGEGAQGLFMRQGNQIISLGYEQPPEITRWTQTGSPIVERDWQGRTIGSFRNESTQKALAALGLSNVPTVNEGDFLQFMKGAGLTEVNALGNVNKFVELAKGASVFGGSQITRTPNPTGISPESLQGTESPATQTQPIYNAANGQWTLGGQPTAAPAAQGPGGAPQPAAGGGTTTSSLTDPVFMQNALQMIYSRRPDLQAVYNPDGTAKNPNDPRVAGIPTLQDWARQYGFGAEALLSGFKSAEGAPVGGADGGVIPQVNIDKARNDAAAAANKIGQDIFDQDEDVLTRASLKFLEDIKTDVETPLLKPPSLAELFAAKRTELGMDVLEKELADIDNQLDMIDVTLLTEADKAGELLISTREIDREKGALQKRADREKAFLQVQRGAVARELTGKLATLELVMNITGQDFDNTSAYYQQTYQRKIDMYNLISGAEDREITRTEKARAAAKANLETIQNSMRDAGLTFDQLTDDQKLQIQKLEMESGLPVGLISTVMNQEPDKKIQTVTSRTDPAGNEYYDVLLVGPNGEMSVSSIFRGKAK